MKHALSFNLIQTAIVIASLTIGRSYAEKMDLPTHDLVIQKLEGVLSSVKDKPATYRGIALRLGDLHSERARLIALQEHDKNCDKCDGSKSDRMKAISYYDQAFTGASTDEKTHILLQKAHLYQIGGDFNKAQSVYQDVISKGERAAGRELYGESLAGRGEMYYRKGEFPKAKKDFEQALRYPIIKKIFVTYRLAWCYLNEGQESRAKSMMIGLLRNPEVEPSFRKDLAHDLATFVARGTINHHVVDELLSFSPDSERKANLFYLGTECDRTGNKNGSLLVWNRYLQLGDVSNREAIEVAVRVAQTRLDIGQKKEALNLMQQAADRWNKKGCTEKDECEELQDRMRNFVITWNKKEKVEPSSEVLSAYAIYISVFKDDYEMEYWAAQLARAQNKLPQALQFYRLSGDVSYDQLRRSNLEPEKRASLQKIKEGSLLAEIEVAEATKDLNAMEQSYNRYLRMNPDGQKALEVRYQLAHVYYDRKDYSKAAEAFYDLGLDKKNQKSDLKVKSADLALDSLAILKDNVRLEKWALEFAVIYPTKKNEYLGIARKASVNQAAALAGDPNASNSTLRAALIKLRSAPLSGATKDEKITILKNEIIIAEKLRELDTVDSASSQLLAIPGLSKENVEFGLARKVWVQELKMNFSEALRLARKMEMKDLTPERRLMRLALLTELAGQNPTGIYEQALHQTRDREKANLIRAKLVRLSRNPWRALDQQIGFLRSTPHILGPLALETFARQQDYNKAERILKTPGLIGTPSGQTLARYVFLRDFSQFESQIARHRLSAGSEQALARSLNERLRLLQQADTWANQALKTSDWTLQIVTLTRVEQENKRLFENISRLPIPRGLRGADREKYQSLLLEKAKPFESKAQTVEDKLAELWRQNQVLDQVLKILATSSKEIRSLIALEMNRLLKSAPDGRKSRVESVIARARQSHSHEELRMARLDLQKHPFDEDYIERVKELEEADGRPAMVPFLDARLAQLHEGGAR